jgi:hypothetical protein
LTAARVSIAGTAVTDLSIRVDALRLRVALGSLLGGHVDARELVLQGPDLHVPWPAEPGTLRARPPPWLVAFATRIENGRLTAGKLVFSGINATLATLETGALSASGTAHFNGYAWDFTARLTRAGADGVAGLDITLDGQGAANGLGASVAGQLAADGTFAGSIAGRGPNLAVLMPAPSVPFRAEGRLSVGSGLIAIHHLALEIGGSPASGAVTLRVSPRPRLDIALSASRLDLDAWLPVLLQGGTTIAGIDIPVGLSISAEAALLRGGTLEQVHTAFDLQGNDLVVRGASALLPGSGSLHLSGRIGRESPEHARFEGDAQLDAPVLRPTLVWLNGAVPGALPPALLAGLPNGVLQRATLSARVSAGVDGTSLKQLAGSVDDTPVAGSIAFRRGEPPTVTADLTLDRLSLGPWLPARTPGLAELSHAASGTDAELRLNVRQATWAGQVVEGLAVDAAIEAGSTLLRRIEGTVQGIHVVASGMLGADGRLSEGMLSLTTPDAASLAEMVPNSWRATPALWHGPATLDVQASGSEEAMAIGARLAMADARLEAEPTIDLRSGEWRGPLTLRHPGARRLVAMLGLPERLGLPGLPAWVGDGSLSLVAHVTAAHGRFAAETFDVTAAALHASGNLALDLNSAEPRLSGLVHADTLPLVLPNSGSEVPLPLGILQGWRGEVRVEVGDLLVGFRHVLDNASAVLAVADDALRCELVSARLGSGTISGSGVLDAAARPPSLSVQARLNNATIAGPLADAPIDLLSGRADADLQLDASGYSPAAIVATLAGRFILTVSDGTLSGFDLFRAKLAVDKSDPVVAEAAARDALSTGATGFDRLDLNASLAHGDLSLRTGILSGIAGEAHFSGGMNLATQALDIRVGLQPALHNPPEIAIHLTGTLDHPDRTPELANLARWMAELAH